MWLCNNKGNTVKQLLFRHARLLGVVAIIISALTWTADLTGFVYECPYCRTQRTVIGLLGLLLLLPRPYMWGAKYIGGVIAAFGFSVGSTQHFSHWNKIISGKFEWGEQWYFNPWMLSGFALFIIFGLVLLLWVSDPYGEKE